MAIPFLDFVDVALNEALNSLRGSSPSVVGIDRKLIVDSLGNQAVLIWALLDDRTGPADRTPDRLRPIAAVIAEKLASQGLAIEPYVHFRLKREHDALQGRVAG